MAIQFDLVNEIKQHWSSKATGALFLKLSNQRLLQLFFVKGELQSVKYHNVVGMEAIKQVAPLAVTKSQFHQGAVSRIAQDLPSTSVIIDMLNINSFDQSVSAKNHGLDAIVSDKERVIIQGVFVEYIGPIADLIFSEELQKADSVDGLIKGLASQLDDLETQVKFREDVALALKR
jgi:hypothetical protein